MNRDYRLSAKAKAKAKTKNKAETEKKNTWVIVSYQRGRRTGCVVWIGKSLKTLAENHKAARNQIE